ncbi:hypothetical protein BC567DRAFT_238702 [Phyllosticta citribraziliensis]
MELRKVLGQAQKRLVAPSPVTSLVSFSLVTVASGRILLFQSQVNSSETKHNGHIRILSVRCTRLISGVKSRRAQQVVRLSCKLAHAPHRDDRTFGAARLCTQKQRRKRETPSRWPKIIDSHPN